MFVLVVIRLGECFSSDNGYRWNCFNIFCCCRKVFNDLMSFVLMMDFSIGLGWTVAVARMIRVFSERTM